MHHCAWGQFLRGELSVPLTVTTFRNHVVEHSQQRMRIRELRGKIREFQNEWAY